MDDFLKEALEIVKAQATVRVMTEEEISSLVRKLTASLKSLLGGETPATEEVPGATITPKGSIKEKSIVCLECGKTFKILSKRHLATHGLTPEQYKEKHGMAKSASLVCKALARERRKKMKDMRLWEKRRQHAPANA